MPRFLIRLYVIALVAVAGVLAFQVIAATPPESITIDMCQSKQAAVTFPHGAHVEVTECSTCHHTQPDLTVETADSVVKCSDCHVDPKDAATPDCAQMSMSKNPFHSLCISCHKDTVAKDSASKAPTKCTECHPKG
ncbi:MAG: cytochrome c3 family protein [Acidobacteriota bacterium]